MSSSPTRRQEIVVGAAAVAIGLVSAAGIHFYPESLRVPPWVAHSGVSAFAFAGMALIAGAFGAKRILPWLGLLVVFGLLVPALWVAFGPGARDCASEYVCRGAFGLGGLLLVAIGVVGIRYARATPEPAGPSIRGKRG